MSKNLNFLQCRIFCFWWIMYVLTLSQLKFQSKKLKATKKRESYNEFSGWRHENAFHSFCIQYKWNEMPPQNRTDRGEKWEEKKWNLHSPFDKRITKQMKNVCKGLKTICYKVFNGIFVRFGIRKMSIFIKWQPGIVRVYCICYVFCIAKPAQDTKVK